MSEVTVSFIKDGKSIDPLGKSGVVPGYELFKHMALGDKFTGGDGISYRVANKEFIQRPDTLMDIKITLVSN